MSLFRDYPQALTLNITDALVLDRIGVGTMYVEGVNFVVNGPYIFSFSNLGVPLTTSELIGGHVFALNASFPANMTGSEFFVDPSSLPAAPTTIAIDFIHAGIDTGLGTLVVQTDGSYVINTTAFNAVPGDYFKFTGPALYDTHLANMFFTGYGTLT
jgi:hypothetical protein